MTYNDLRKGRHSEIGREYFVPLVVAGRRPVFQDFGCARLMVDALRSMVQEGRLLWLAWVIMPDHFHGLLRLEQGGLSESMRLLGGRSARSLNRYLGLTGNFWQPGYHDHALRAEEDRSAIARYIVANPLRAGLVTRLGEYPHWDSLWL